MEDARIAAGREEEIRIDSEGNMTNAVGENLMGRLGWAFCGSVRLLVGRRDTQGGSESWVRIKEDITVRMVYGFGSR